MYTGLDSGTVSRLMDHQGNRGLVDRLLILSANCALREHVAAHMAPAGFQVEAAPAGEQGLRRALSGDHALVLLDLDLPGGDRFDSLRYIRRSSGVPVSVLATQGDDIDRIVAFEIGADDYITVPFNPRELQARVRAVLRRSGTAARWAACRLQNKITVGDLTLEKGARVVRCAGRLVNLTAVEFDLLRSLLEAAGRVVRREDLVRAALGREASTCVRSINMHMSNLRKKLGPGGDCAGRIKTVRGVGYLYALPEEIGAKRD
jgi:two-component system response regulator CpxR